MADSLPEPSDKAKKKKSRFIVNLLLMLGVLQVYNIISHHQDLIDISQSIQLIAAWWRYTISIPFDFIHWELTPLQREIFVLLLFFGTAANAIWYRDHGQVFLISVWRFAKPGYDIDEPVPDEFQEVLGNFLRARSSVVAFLLLCMMFGFVFVDDPVDVLGVGLYSAVATIIVYRLAPDAHRRRRLQSIAASVILLPALLVCTWLGAIAAYHAKILRSLRFLLILLIADLIAKYAVDPLLQRLPELPRPPVA